MRVHNITFGNKQTYKTFDEIQNERLAELYERYQKKPFKFAIINYAEDGTSKVKIYPKQNFFKNCMNKFVKLIKK